MTNKKIFNFPLSTYTFSNYNHCNGHLLRLMRCTRSLLASACSLTISHLWSAMTSDIEEKDLLCSEQADNSAMGLAESLSDHSFGGKKQKRSDTELTVETIDLSFNTFMDYVGNPHSMTLSSIQGYYT